MSEVNIAKLMYYINAVNTCINIKVDSKFLSYLNADRLTEQEKVDVVALAAHYRPNVMKNLTFFEVGNDQISSKLNRFVALNDPYVRDELQLSSAVVFDNTKLKLRKVMLHTSEFFSDFFEIPFEAEEWRISSTSHTVSYLLVYRTIINILFCRLFKLIVSLTSIIDITIMLAVMLPFG